MRSADSFLFLSLVRAQVETGQFCLRNSPLEKIFFQRVFFYPFLSIVLKDPGHIPSSLDTSPLSQTTPDQDSFQRSLGISRVSLILGRDVHQLICNHGTCEVRDVLSGRADLTQCLLGEFGVGTDVINRKYPKLRATFY